MEGVVLKQERAKRSKMLHILSDKKRRAFYEEHIGKTYNVLFESEQHENYLNGFTDNYIKVKVPYSAELENQICQVTLKSIDAEGVVEVENVKSLSPKTNNQKLTTI